ncbi:hypothetical protein ACU686_13390 [Yinghuangia aomiensis]
MVVTNIERMAPAAVPVRLAGAIRATRRAGWSRSREIDDVKLGAYLVAQALVEIRSLAADAVRHGNNASGSTYDEVFDRIRFLANLCDNMPSRTFDIIQIRALAGSTARKRDTVGGASDAEALGGILALADGCLTTPWSPENGLRRRVGRPGRTSRHEQAMTGRPLAWAWHTTGPEEHAWILQHVAGAGLRWTSPPALLARRKDVPLLTARLRVGLLVRWPVKGRTANERLPRAMRVVKSLDGNVLRALYEEAWRLRLGLGSASPWLDAHTALDAATPAPAPSRAHRRGHGTRCLPTGPRPQDKVFPTNHAAARRRRIPEWVGVFI